MGCDTLCFAVFENPSCFAFVQTSNFGNNIQSNKGHCPNMRLLMSHISATVGKPVVTVHGCKGTLSSFKGVTLKEEI